MTDRYFDHLGARFAQRIYDSPKGAIRLAVLQRDLQQWLPALLQAESPLHILDIGAGLGQISGWLAGLGHQLPAHLHELPLLGDGCCESPVELLLRP